MKILTVTLPGLAPAALVLDASTDIAAMVTLAASLGATLQVQYLNAPLSAQDAMQMLTDLADQARNNALKAGQLDP